jgi:hypothetical protein
LYITGATNVKIRICNAMGQLVQAAENTSRISVSALPAGMYFVSVLNNDGTLLRRDKIIKE